ncbi:DUF3784 domain-containing protein [Fredinandcohnia sp. QZ13]|uniref:DUF3784 domain-containing protein n=1 Tax=Fredinandcohnia sp. QZ13 TaxID=3073144 RepID=UPI0028534898|nr:DUF3784 domain-containing protein [Fredinandcohnia sp. QZ13]MDR4888197.1 DUF3784 domain-containing protein [Fredinandcohnia sp. QZ13]
MLAGFITCFFAGLLCILLGFLIWKKKQLSLIAGYNEETYKGDKEKLAKVVGLFTIIVGLLTILLPFGLEFVSELFGLLFGAIITIGSIVLIIYVNKFNKPTDLK